METRDLISQLEQADHNAFIRSCEYIQPNVLIAAIHELHELLPQYCIEVADLLSRNQREAISDCLQAIRKEFLFGCLTCLRAHSTDSENYRRKAIEFCAFGVQMLREPHWATIWLDSVKSKRKYREYKSNFKIMEILKAVSDTGIKLALLYEELSKSVHASPYAIKTQTRIYLLGQTRLNYLDYHDDATGAEQYALAQRFITEMYADFYIIVVFAAALSAKFSALDMSRWNRERDRVFELLHAEQLRVQGLGGGTSQ